MGGCLPAPLLAPPRKPASAEDTLVEHLLAAHSRPPRQGASPALTHDAAQERTAAAAADALRHAWNDVSLGYGATYGKSTSERASRPYAETIVARDSDPLASAPTRNALARWNDAPEPLAHKYVMRRAD